MYLHYCIVITEVLILDNFYWTSFNLIIEDYTAVIHENNFISYMSIRGTVVAQWLRYFSTNWKVAVSIPDGFIGIFH